MSKWSRLKMKIDSFNSSGFSLIESMIAIGIVTSSALVLTWAMSELQKNRLKVEYITGASALEASLTQAMVDANNYSDTAVKASLQQSQVPTGLALKVQGTTGAQNINFTISPGQTVGLDRNFQPCTANANAPCAYTVAIDLQPVDNRMAYAYTIKTALPDVSLNYQPTSGNAATATKNYSVTIPYENYLSSLSLMCDPSRFLGVRGVNSGTGNVACIKLPDSSVACPARTVAKSLTMVADPSGGDPSVAFQCGGLQTASCPTGYSLNTIDTRSLDSGATKSGQCVYSLAHTAAGPTLTGQSIVGQVCPPNYLSQSTCTVVTTSSAQGVCQPNPWCDQYSCSSSGYSENPVGTMTATINYSCSHSITKTVPAVPAQVVFTQNRAGGLAADGMVDCHLAMQPQQCGATWQGQAQLQVNCVLNSTGANAAVQEFVNVQ